MERGRTKMENRSKKKRQKMSSEYRRLISIGAILSFEYNGVIEGLSIELHHHCITIHTSPYSFIRLHFSILFLCISLFVCFLSLFLLFTFVYSPFSFRFIMFLIFLNLCSTRKFSYIIRFVLFFLSFTF